MVAVIFLLFVATGITIASVIYGFGGLFPLMVSVGVVSLLLFGIGRILRRRAPEPVIV